MTKRLGKHSSIYYKRVIDGSGNILGYIKNNIIYMRSENRDEQDMFWFNIAKADSDKYRYDVKSENSLKTIGHIDHHNNIFMLDGSYVGTVKAKKRPLVILSSILVLAIGTITSSLVTTNVMKSLGITKAKESERPVIKIEGLSDNINWEGTQQIDIFSSSYLGKLKLLYPDCSGVYEFEVENKNNATMEYSFKFAEDNVKQIPIRFRLKTGNCYLLGSDERWLSIDEMKLYNLVLPEDSSALYSLEWKWCSEDNDADVQLAKDDTSLYSINIGCTAWLENAD